MTSPNATTEKGDDDAGGGPEPPGAAAATGDDPVAVTEIDEESRPRAAAPSQRSLGEVVAPVFHSERTMFTVLVVAAIYWVITLGRLVVLRHNRFGTFDFDTGIYDQFLWQAAHFRGFSTVRGVTFFGHHASFGFFFLVPFAWLGAGPNFWNVFNAVALASCAPILYVIARDRFGRPWISAAVGLAWLAQPSVQWWVHEGFHPECVALPFLFATWLFGQRIAQRLGEGVAVERRLQWWFWLSLLGAVMWKEDLALAVVGMGLVWMIRRHWRLGIPVVIAAALWFAVFGAFMVPQIAGGTVYSGIYGELGATPGEMVFNSVQDPGMLLERWQDNDALGYSSRLHRSFGYVAVLSPVTWLIGAPQWFADISSAASFTWDMRYRYQAIPTVALTISFVEAAWFLSRKRRWLGEAAIVLGLTAALWSGWVHGPGPWSPDNYRAGYWPLSEPATQDAKEAALALIRPGDGVSADYLLVPHLTHREVIYTFPNPWRNSNYGVENSALGDPAAVDWIVVDTALVNDENRTLYDSIKASGEFQVAMQRDGVEVLRRIEPPGRGTAPIDTG